MVWSRPTCDVNGILGGYTGKGSKTVLAGASECQILVPACRIARSGQNRGNLPGFRQGAAARRLPRRIYLAWRVGRGATAVQFGGVVAGRQGIAGRMGQGAGAGRVRRLDPGRRRFQARSRDGHIDDRVWLGGRSHSLAEREIRTFLVSQGSPKLGTGLERAGAVTQRAIGRIASLTLAIHKPAARTRA